MPRFIRQILVVTKSARKKCGENHEKYTIVTQDPVMQDILDTIKKASPTAAPVLITGESGTGKELVANSLYFHSPRSNKPFVKVNCAALPDELLESELFGHEKGAFTGAVKVRQGRFELADTGTIFLDEIGDMSLKTQAKILRVLQEQEFERVGGTKTLKTDIRIIVATNKELEKLIEQEKFREDLYYRLSVIPIHLPPLRERAQDVLLLTEYFVQHYTTVYHKEIQAREEYSWDEIEYGEEKILKLHIFPFKDEDYKLLGTIIIIEDVSKERYFTDYLLRTEKIASIAELAAGVAHEINNPLGIIQNYVAYLKDRNTDQDSAERLDKVENELERIEDIIESLLSFSKLRKLPMKRINLTIVLNEVVILLSHKLKEKNIQLLWQESTLEVPIFGDENRLKQVFINLIVNSIEAVMYEGVIEITMAVHQEHDYVEISVSDDGYGIPDETMKKIFDPFFSTKVGKKNSGLGLSICQHIIESHQGIITCSSGEKTTFSVRLPMIES